MYHLWWVWLIIALLVAGAVAWAIWYYYKEEEDKSTALRPPIQPLHPAQAAMMAAGGADPHSYGVGEDGQMHSVDEPCASGLHHHDGSYTSSNVLYPGSYVMPSHYMTRGYSPSWGLGYGPVGDGGYGAGLSKSQVAKHPGLKGLVHQPAAMKKWYREHNSPSVPLVGHGKGQGTFGDKGYWEGYSNPVSFP